MIKFLFRKKITAQKSIFLNIPSFAGNVVVRFKKEKIVKTVKKSHIGPDFFCKDRPKT